MTFSKELIEALNLTPSRWSAEVLQELRVFWKDKTQTRLNTGCKRCLFEARNAAIEYATDKGWILKK